MDKQQEPTQAGTHNIIVLQVAFSLFLSQLSLYSLLYELGNEKFKAILLLLAQ